MQVRSLWRSDKVTVGRVRLRHFCCCTRCWRQGGVVTSGAKLEGAEMLHDRASCHTRDRQPSRT